MTASEAYNLPIAVKRWWIDRIVKELNRGKENPNETSPSRALHNNSPEVRQMQGMNRPAAPSRLRRFT